MASIPLYYHSVCVTNLLMRTIFALALFLAPFTALAFGPCNQTSPEGVSYLPSVRACGGKAAIVTFGKYVNAFSAVVRDCNNNDRDPCNKGVTSCASNYSSPFKAQKVLSGVIKSKGHNKSAKIFCLKESGSSNIYKLVRRMTIKLRNPVTSPSHVLKICLSSRTTAKNSIKIVSTHSPRSISSIGYSAVCKNQSYLACSTTYKAICPQY